MDYPEEVRVKEIGPEGEGPTVIELRVHRDDLGKVIGKQGRTARALRTVLKGAKGDGRCDLNIVE